MVNTKVAYIYYGKFSTDQTSAVQAVNTINALSSLAYDIDLINTAGARQFAAHNDLTIEAQVNQPPINLDSETPNRVVYYTYCLYRIRFADVVFTRDIGFLKFMSELPLSLDTPIIYEGHQCYSGIGAMSAAEERSRLEQADVVITESQGVANDLEALRISVSEVILNAANEQFIPDSYPQSLADRYGIDDSWTTVIYAGSLDEWKNDLELLLTTISTIDAKMKLLIVGGDDQKVKRLQQFARDKGLTPDRAVFVGRVPHKKVYQYLAIADIGAVPLKLGTAKSTKYTSPVKLFEYLASKLRVVASDVPAVRAIEDPNIQCYTPGEVESMHQCLLKAASETFQETEHSYTYGSRAERISNLIQEL